MHRTSFIAALALLACGCSGSEPGSDGPVTSADAAPKDGSAPELGTLVPGKWIKIEPGSFTMGSPASELCREGDEDQHQVTLTRAFEIAETEVTQKQYGSLMLHNPSHHQSCGDECPVEWVTWHEAAAYCNGVSQAKDLPPCYSCTGEGQQTRCDGPTDLLGCKGYRLPTEAEWEHAARAGVQTPFPNGGIASCMGTDGNADKVAWYKVNSLGELHAVKTKASNAWQLYDMHGGVYEWVHDWYQTRLGTKAATDPTGASSGTERVLRGGAWYFNAEHARAASRERFRPDKPFNFAGFRCARTL